MMAATLQCCPSSYKSIAEREEIQSFHSMRSASSISRMGAIFFEARHNFLIVVGSVCRGRPGIRKVCSALRVPSNEYRWWSLENTRRNVQLPSLSYSYRIHTLSRNMTWMPLLSTAAENSSRSQWSSRAWICPSPVRRQGCRYGFILLHYYFAQSPI